MLSDDPITVDSDVASTELDATSDAIVSVDDEAEDLVIPPVGNGHFTTNGLPCGLASSSPASRATPPSASPLECAVAPPLTASERQAQRLAAEVHQSGWNSRTERLLFELVTSHNIPRSRRFQARQL
eukprot:6482759-Amphidinium_carterae.1